jgi:hypothetical protein
MSWIPTTSSLESFLATNLSNIQLPPAPGDAKGNPKRQKARQTSAASTPAATGSNIGESSWPYHCQYCGKGYKAYKGALETHEMYKCPEHNRLRSLQQHEEQSSGMHPTSEASIMWGIGAQSYPATGWASNHYDSTAPEDFQVDSLQFGSSDANYAQDTPGASSSYISPNPQSSIHKRKNRAGFVDNGSSPDVEMLRLALSQRDQQTSVRQQLI